MTPAAAELTALGESVQFTAQVRDQNGQTMPAAVVTWASADTAVATVDATGLVTAAGNGTVTITATSGGASGSGSVTVVQAVSAVAVSPAADTLVARGDTVRLRAEGSDANGHAVAGAEFAWASGDTAVATVDATGLATAAGNGTVTITATSGGASGSGSVTVVQAVSAVAVSPAADTLVARGDTVRLRAEASDANGHAVAGAEFAWASGDTAVATVDATGLATAAGNGTVTITATSGGASGSASLTVVQAVSAVAVSPAADTLVAWGDTVRLRAEASDANGHAVEGAEFTWASGDTTVATVDATGLATAAGNGTVTITATSGGASGSASLTVVQAVSAVAVSPAAGTLVARGDTVQLRAEASDANGHAVEGADFTWASGDTTVATVDATGLATGIGSGEVEITASSSGVAGRASLVVVEPVPAAMTVMPDTLALTALGDAAQLAAEVRDQIGRVMEGVRVSWSSANAVVAAVDSAGVVTAIGVGSAIVTAWAGEVSGSTLVKVMPAAGWVVVSPPADTIAPGDTVRVEAELFDGNGRRVSAAAFNWSSSDVSVASVDGAGLVRGVGEGAATITAVAGDVAGISEITVANLERAALVALYEATDGPNWANSDNWLTDAPLGDWYGVRTDGSGRVVSLELEGHRDPEHGWIPQGLSGPIPTELAHLARLRQLRLRGNALSGPIPAEFGSLVNLENLSLGHNNLSGPIPSELANLAQLRYLNLYDNALEGPIPAEFGSLVNLESLYLGDNNLSGPIPSELASPAKLRVLNLWGAALTGPIPSELGDLADLESLNLGNNDLTGPIPAEFGSLVNLERLYLDHNELSGPIPQSFLQLDRLQAFYIGRNEGLCVPATYAFVAWLAGIERRDESGAFCNESDRRVLESLFERASGAHWTNADGWVSDPALGEWHGVRTDSLGRVTALDLERNGLSGRLPASLGHLAQMTELRIGGNTALSGPLPQSLAALSLRVLHYGGTGVCAPSQTRFQEWLNAIPSHEGTGAGCALSDREILEVAYETLGGPGWFESGNWLTDRPLGDWRGVEVDTQGRVTGLRLDYNGISGWIPPELGSLEHLGYLILARSSGVVGAIPAELGDLANLRQLELATTNIGGTIPAELGDLANLRWLRLGENNLEGAIPVELGRLRNLAVLDLQGNQLAGTVPVQLGSLADLRRLYLGDNELTGQIPARFGSLSRLRVLSLDRNGLVGPLPAELGGLAGLQELHVGHNSLHGTVPVEFQGLTSLRRFSLQGNEDMSGALPAELATLDSLETLVADGTGLCAPSDPGFLNWLGGLLHGRVSRCESSPAMAYLVQAVQSREFPVPLVAGEEALLRTFVTATRANQEPLPRVRASFHVGAARVHVAEIPATAGPIPTEVEQGSLAASANAVIPADVIRPGLEMVIEIDPDGTLDPGLGVARRIPETGRIQVDVREMPVLDLTVIPFLWSADPDSAILDQTAGMAADPHGHELLADARTLLPVGGFKVTTHAPVLSSSNSILALVRETGTIRALEAGSGHWMGMMSGPREGSIGGAISGRRVSASIPRAFVIAHELGHNMSLVHAPCGGAGRPDPAFPYGDGSSGAWGYGFRDGGSLVHPSTPDVMSYCSDPHWISDYHFTKALRFRLADEGSGSGAMVAEPAASLMLWGGVDADGVPFLEPAFAVDAPPLLPDSAGDYRITGTAAGGETLFSISFTMPVLADADGESSFVFIVPARPSWQAALAAITLTGPGGTATLNGESNRAMAILRDPLTGQVRGFLRDLPAAARVAADLAGRTAGPGLDMLLSSGIPDAAAWRR